MLPPPNCDSQHSIRPTLPPIRDLFRDELLADSSPKGSPSLTLARLHVSENSSRCPTPRELPNSSTGHGHGDYLGSNDSWLSSSGSRKDEYHPIRHPADYLDVSQSMQYTSSNDDPLTAHLSASPNVSAQLSRPNRVNYMAHQTTAENESYDRTNQLASGSHSSPRTHLRAPGISTIISLADTTDDERTPLARYGEAPSDDSTRERQEGIGNSVPSKYECNYCGKGFTRPSSLKIHLNSHTGEKPFVCPAENCGRSFSVLSNMRRHARVHTLDGLQSGVQSDDDSRGKSSIISTPSTTSSRTAENSPYSYIGEGSQRWLRRRDSSASTSSNRSHRSHSASSTSDLNIENDSGRPEKRSRRHLT